MKKKDLLKMLENFDDEIEVGIYNSATDTVNRIRKIAVEENDEGFDELVIEVS